MRAITILKKRMTDKKIKIPKVKVRESIAFNDKFLQLIRTLLCKNNISASILPTSSKKSLENILTSYETESVLTVNGLENLSEDATSNFYKGSNMSDLKHAYKVLKARVDEINSGNKLDLPVFDKHPLRIYLCKAVFIARQCLRMNNSDYRVPNPDYPSCNVSPKHTSTHGVSSSQISERKLLRCIDELKSILKNDKSGERLVVVAGDDFYHKSFSKFPVLCLWVHRPSYDSYMTPSGYNPIPTEIYSSQQLSMPNFDDGSPLISQSIDYGTSLNGQNENIQKGKDMNQTNGHSSSNPIDLENDENMDDHSKEIVPIATFSLTTLTPTHLKFNSDQEIPLNDEEFQQYLIFNDMSNYVSCWSI